MVLGKLPVPGRPIIWMIVGQGPIALAVGAGGGCLDIFTLLYHFYFLSPFLLETARYRLKYCLKGPLNQKQQTNQSLWETARYRLKYCLKGPLSPKQPTNHLLIWTGVGQGPTAFAVGAGGDCLDNFTLVCHFSFLSPSLRETVRYRLKYC